MEMGNYISLMNNNHSYEKIENINPLDSHPSIIFSPINSKININIIKLTNNIPQESIIPNNPDIELYNQINNNSNKKTLVLDLDETLVHSSITPFPNKNNIILRLNIAGNPYTIYVIKRPFVEEFLEAMSKYYEIVVFTASISEYSKPLISIIDKNKVVKYILNRENCTFMQGLFIKNLKLFNRDLKDIIIVDNNPASYAFNKENGIPILTWIDNPYDNELIKLIPLLRYLSKVNDVRPIINQIINKENGQLNLNEVNKLLNINNLTQVRKLNNFNQDNNIININKVINDENINFNNSIDMKINNHNNLENYVHQNDIQVNKLKYNNLNEKIENENNRLIISHNNNIGENNKEKNISDKFRNNVNINVNKIYDGIEKSNKWIYEINENQAKKENNHLFNNESHEMNNDNNKISNENIDININLVRI